MSTYKPVPDQDQTVLLGTIRAHPWLVILNLLFAVLFAKRGCRVSMLVDDGTLPHLDAFRRDQGTVAAVLGQRDRRRSNAGKTRRWVRRFWERYGKPAGVELHFYSELLGDRWEEIHSEVAAKTRLACEGAVSPHVRASHNRFFGGRNFVTLDRDHMEYAKLSIENEVINEIVAKIIFQHLKPDVFAVIDGIYTSCGVLTDYMRQQGVRIRIHQPFGAVDESLADHLIAITDQPFVLSNVSENWERFVTNDYSADLRDQAIALLEKRIGSKRHPVCSDTRRWMSVVEAKRVDYSRVIGLFPNLTWDANIPSRDKLFNSFADWLVETVAWAGRSSTLVVIREHPQQDEDYTAIGSSIALLSESMPGLEKMDHVLLIRGSQPCNSYTLIEHVLDNAVVYSGTLAVEVPYLQRPVVLAGESLFSKKGIGFEPQSRAEYFDFLERLSAEDREFSDRKGEFYENALRAAAYQFIFALYYCPIAPRQSPPVGRGNHYLGPWDLTESELNPDLNPAWQRTIDRFLN